ncbi:unnamed protein product, partial [Discosporangium mesarthrocarpum]
LGLSRAVNVAGGAEMGGGKEMGGSEASPRHQVGMRMDLACWLLETLSREASRVPGVASSLYTRDALGVLHDCLRAPLPTRRRVRVIHLITSIVVTSLLPQPQTLNGIRLGGDGRSIKGDGTSRGLGWARLAGCGQACMPDVGSLSALLATVQLQTARQLQHEEPEAHKSQYLQVLVQLAVTMGMHMGAVSHLSGWMVSPERPNLPATEAALVGGQGSRGGNGKESAAGVGVGGMMEGASREDLSAGRPGDEESWWAAAEVSRDGEGSKTEFPPMQHSGLVGEGEVAREQRSPLLHLVGAATSAGMGSGGVAGGKGNLGVVQEVTSAAIMLHSFSCGVTPQPLLLAKFFPLMQEAWAACLHSQHPLDRTALSCLTVSVPGATSMEARFDVRTEMGKEDRIIIRSRAPNPAPEAGTALARVQASSTALPQGHVGAGAPGAGMVPPLTPGKSSEEDSVTLVGLVGGTSEDDLPPISVGDIVVRGPDWEFGNEDSTGVAVLRAEVGEWEGGNGTQGSGSPHMPSSGREAAPGQEGELPRGEVVGLEEWGGRPEMGVRVRWGSSHRTHARDSGWDIPAGGGGKGGEGFGCVDGEPNSFEALYSAKDPTHLRVLARGGSSKALRPVVIPGDSLEVTTMSGSETPGHPSLISGGAANVPGVEQGK